MRNGRSSLPDWVWAGTTTAATLISQFTIGYVGTVSATPSYDGSTGEFSLYRTSASALTGLVSPTLVLGSTYSITIANTSAQSITVRAGSLTSAGVSSVAANTTSTITFTVTSSYGDSPWIGISGGSNGVAYSGTITEFYLVS